VLGLLTKHSQRHIAGELCLRVSDTLVVGSLKHSVQYFTDGRGINGTFFDTRTTLPADEVRNSDMLEQGSIAAQVVAAWFDQPTDPENDLALADQIPFLPRREDDYTLRSAVVRH
jgi:hypothetical protein